MRDAFQQQMETMKKMSAKERENAVADLKTRCTCPECPSYNDCAKNANELLFCATGKSFMCTTEEKGSICPTCPVAKELALKSQFFCTRGSEKAQRFEHTVWGASLVK